MSLDAARATLFSEFQTGFAAKQPGVPICFENQRFDQPKNTAWVYAAMLPGLSKRMNFGGDRKFRHQGVFNVTCMAPEDSGTKTLTDIAEAVFETLADRIIGVPGGGQIVTFGIQRKTRGLINGVYVINVMVEYRHDEVLGT